MEQKKLRTAAYIRVSTDRDDQENSFEMQRSYFEKLLSSNKDYENAGIYSDCGISGGSTARRPGICRLLLDCRKGRIDRIICKSISRFSRNTPEFIQMLSMLRENKVTVFFEKENIDTAHMINEIVITALSAAAQNESVSISKNLHWSDVRRYRSGEAPNKIIYGYRWAAGCTVMPSGYKYRNIEINPDEAEIVRRIFSDVSTGKRYCDIARSLNADGIAPPLCRSRKTCPQWNGRHIYNIISNERYAGCVLTQKNYTADSLHHLHRRNRGELEQCLISCHHNAIISREQYESVKNVLMKNSCIYGNNHTGHRRTQILSGLLYCPSCKKRMHTNGRSRTPYWFCPGRCGRRIDEADVFSMIEKAVYLRFGRDEHTAVNITDMFRYIDENDRHKENDPPARKPSPARIQLIRSALCELKSKASLCSGKEKASLDKAVLILKRDLKEEIRKADEMIFTDEKKELPFEDCISMYDKSKMIGTMLSGENGINKLTVKMLIRSIVGRIAVLSGSDIAVQWADDSAVRVRGGM